MLGTALNAPGAGYFDIVDVPASILVNRDSFYPVNEQWLRSAWVGGYQMPYTDGANGPGSPSNFVSKIGNDVDSCYVVDLDTMKVVCSGTNRGTSLDCFAQFEKLINQ